jgi:carbamoyl-phosphate synthase large subunit
VFVSVKDSDKALIAPPVRALASSASGHRDRRHGRLSARQGIEVERVNKVAQGRPHIVDKIKDGEVDLIFNTTEGWQSHKDSASIRASALMAKVPYFTTAASSAAVVRAIGALNGAPALKFARFRTIIPPPERDPHHNLAKSGRLFHKGRPETGFDERQ